MKGVDILKCFIVAERTGNWEQHLYAINCMLPLSAPQHHVNYARASFVYLQHVCELHASSTWMHEQFLNGLRNVRKSDRYWAGLSSTL